MNNIIVSDTDANSLFSQNENNSTENLGEQMLTEISVNENNVEEPKEEVNEVDATALKIQSVNALYSPMQKAFDEMQKDIEKNKINVEMDYSISSINGMQLLSNDIKEIPRLVEPILHRVGLAAFVGSSDVGKSSLLRDLAISVVTGMDFLGWKVNPIHHSAIYVSTEDDQMSISSLLKMQNKDYGFIPEDLENLVFIFETDNLLERLENELKKKLVDLIIIDAFADLFTAELYKTNEVRAFLNQYNQLAQRYGCLIIFLHHTRKSSEELQPSKNNSLGSQGFEAKMRFMAEIKSNIQSPAKKHFCIVKGNYLPNEFKTKSFDILFTENLTFKSLGTRTPFDKLNKVEESYESLEIEYDNINYLRNSGLTLREIGLKFNVSHVTISNKIKKFEKLREMKELGNK